MAGGIALNRELDKHKKDRLFKQSAGHFLNIECGECGQRAVCYSHSQTKIFCKNCNDLLVKPTGGAAEMVGKTKFKRAENVY